MNYIVERKITDNWNTEWVRTIDWLKEKRLTHKTEKLMVADNYTFPQWARIKMNFRELLGYIPDYYKDIYAFRKLTSPAYYLYLVHRKGGYSREEPFKLVLITHNDLLAVEYKLVMP